MLPTAAPERGLLSPRGGARGRSAKKNRPGSRGTSPATRAGGLDAADAAASASLASSYARQLGECMRQFNAARASTTGAGVAAPPPARAQGADASLHGATEDAMARAARVSVHSGAGMPPKSPAKSPRLSASAAALLSPGRRERNPAAAAAAAALEPMDLMSRLDLAGGLTRPPARHSSSGAVVSGSEGPLAAEVRSLTAAQSAEAAAWRSREASLSGEVARLRDVASGAEARAAASARAAAAAAAEAAEARDSLSALAAQHARVSAALEERRAEAAALHEALAAAAAAHAQRTAELTRRAAAAEADAAAARAQLAAAQSATADKAQAASKAAAAAFAAASAKAKQASPGAAAALAAAEAAAAQLRNATAKVASPASPARSAPRRRSGGTPGSSGRRNRNGSASKSASSAGTGANAPSSPAPSPAGAARRAAEVHKLRGNAAFHSARFDDAVSEYSAGLGAIAAVSGPSGAPPAGVSAQAADALRVTRAMLHSNRAAALQQQGRLLDCVADCAMALALDPGYLRALQRRADAWDALGDPAAAARDLEALAAAAATPEEAASLRARAAAITAQARRATSCGPDHYAVLGVAPNAPAAAIKAAYRQAALRHHPDKAPADGGAGVRASAEALFKMAAQAYATLSDAALRRRYDAQRALAQAADAAAHAR